MATRSRIGYVLPDDSIVSVYHHWDGYPEWLGVTLNREYNTEEKVRKLIDGGNMSNCWSDSKFNTETKEFDKVEPHVNYYDGDDERPEISATRQEAAGLNWDAEFIYFFMNGNWECFSIKQKFDKEGGVVESTILPVEIPAGDVADDS